MFPIEAFHATLAKAVRIFRELGIRFHLTGGIASIYYGEPRNSWGSGVGKRLDRETARKRT